MRGHAPRRSEGPKLCFDLGMWLDDVRLSLHRFGHLWGRATAGEERQWSFQVPNLSSAQLTSLGMEVENLDFWEARVVKG